MQLALPRCHIAYLSSAQNFPQLAAATCRFALSPIPPPSPRMLASSSLLLRPAANGPSSLLTCSRRCLAGSCFALPFVRLLLQLHRLTPCCSATVKAGSAVVNAQSQTVIFVGVPSPSLFRSALAAASSPSIAASGRTPSPPLRPHPLRPPRP
jgi:hypothetical protein